MWQKGERQRGGVARPLLRTACVTPFGRGKQELACVPTSTVPTSACGAHVHLSM